MKIRSLNRNFDNLVNFFTSIKSKFSVTGISETTIPLILIVITSLFHKHRPSRPGGGVGMHLDVDLALKFRNDLSIVTDESLSVESLFIEVSRPKRNKLIVRVIYRGTGL